MGIVRKGKPSADRRFFVLYRDHLDYYHSSEDYEEGRAVRGRLGLDAIEELEVLDSGFRIMLTGTPQHTLELMVFDRKDLHAWVDALEPLLDPDSAQAPGADKREINGEEYEEYEEDVLHDGPVGIVEDGKARSKHLWLFADRIDYTEKDDYDDPIISFQFQCLQNLKVTQQGFELVLADKRVLIETGTPEQAEEWMKFTTKSVKEWKQKSDGSGSSVEPMSAAVTPESSRKDADSAAGSAPQVTAAAEDAPLAAPSAPTQLAPAATAAQKIDEAKTGEDDDEEVEEIEEEVVFDGPLKVVSRDIVKHFWLFADRLEYTETSDYDEPLESFALLDIKDLKGVDPPGFVLQIGSGKMVLQTSSREEADEWIRELTKAIKEERKKAKRPSADAKRSSSGKRSSQQATPAQCEDTENAQVDAAGVVDGQEVPHKDHSKDMDGESEEHLIYRAGVLNISRKNRMDSRFFTLSKESFDYWTNEEDYASSQPVRGCMMLVDISTVQENDAGFVITLAEDGRSLKLCAESESDRVQWIQQWAVVLELHGRSASLKAKSEPPAKSDGQASADSEAATKSTSAPQTSENYTAVPHKADRSQTPTSSNQKQEGRVTPPRNRHKDAIQRAVTLESTPPDQVRDQSEEVSKAHIQVQSQEGNGDKFQSQGRKVDKVQSQGGNVEKVQSQGRKVDKVQSQGVKADKVQSQAGSADKAQSQSGKVDKVQSQSGNVEIVHSQVSKADKGQSQAGTADNVQSQPVKGDKVQSQTGKADKVQSQSGKVEKVQSLDKMHSPRTKVDKVQSQAGNGNKVQSQPGKVQSQVGNVDKVQGQGGKVDKMQSPRSKVDKLQSQAGNANKVQSQPGKVQSQVGNADKMQTQSGKTDEEPSQVDNIQTFERQAGVNDKVQSQEGNANKADDVASALKMQDLSAVQATGKVGGVIAEPTSPAWPEPAAEPVSEPQAEPRPAAATDTSPQESQIAGVHEEGLIHKGDLAIDRKAKGILTRYFALFDNRLDYFTSSQDMVTGQEPRGRVLLADVQSVDLMDNGWELNLVSGRTLSLQAPSSTEWVAWDTAWKRVFAQEPVEEQPPHGQEPVEEQPPQMEHPPAMQEQPGDEGPFLAGSVHEGVLITSGSRKYVAIFPDRIEYWADATSARRRSRPQMSIPKTGVEDLEVVESGFDVRTRDGVLALRTLDASSLEQWLESFSKVFAEEDDSQQPEPQPHSAEDQGAQPPHFGRDRAQQNFGRRDLPGQQGRILWQSMLEVQSNKSGEWQYFALYDDSLSSFMTPNDLVEGREPRKKIPHERIKLLELSSNSFTLHFHDGGKLALRVGTEPGIMQAWVTAWRHIPGINFVGVSNTQANRLLRPQPAGGLGEDPLLQGNLDLERSDHVETRYFVLYADRLMSFRSAKACREGDRPKYNFRLAAVQDIKVFHTGFFLQHNDVSYRLHARPGKDFETWKSSLNRVFFIAADPVTNSSSDPIHQGLMKMMGGDGKPLKRYFLLYKDRLECYAGNPDSRTADPRGQVQLAGIKGFKQLEDGFVLVKEAGELEVRVRDAKDLEAWHDAFQSVVNSHTNGSCIFPVHQGPLGIQHGSCLVSKHFVLYPDRLDYFHKASEVATSKPCGRIALIEVLDHEVFGNGLILNLGGRKIGLKADSEADRVAWDSHLRKALANVVGQRHEQASADRDRGKSPRDHANPGDNTDMTWPASPSTPPRSVSPRRQAKPRVYNHLGMAGSPGPSPSPGMDSSLSMRDESHELSRSRSAPPGPRTPLTPSTVRSPRSPAPGDWQEICTFDKWRHTGGRLWRTTAVSPKVSAREVHFINKEKSGPANFECCRKVTDQKNRPLTPRSPAVEPPPKVGVPESDKRVTVRQLNNEKEARHVNRVKITEAGRTFKVPAGPDAAPVTPKITNTPRGHE